MDAVTLPATSSGIFTVPTSFQTASDPLEAVYKKHKHFRPLSELMSSALGSFEEPSQADLAEAKRVGLENLEERARRWGTVADELYATWSQERLDKGLSHEILTVSKVPHQYEERSDISDWMEYLWERILKYTIKGFKISEQTSVCMCDKRRPDWVEEVLIPKEITRIGSFRLYDEDGVLFLYKLENGVMEYARGTDGFFRCPQHIQNQKFDDELVAIFPANPPSTDKKKKSTDSRHPNDRYHEKEKAWWEKNGCPIGVHHFGIWTERGGTNAMKSTAFVTSDSKGGRTGTRQKKEARKGAAERWLEQMAMTEAAMGVSHYGADRASFLKQRAHRQHMVTANTGLQEFNQWQSGTLIARVGQKACRVHKDSGDAKGNIATTVCFGLLSGGHICYPGIDERIPQLPDDVVGCVAAKLDHMVMPFTGRRTCVVSTSKSDKDTVVQPLDYLDPESARQAIAVHEQNVANNLEKYKVVHDIELKLIGACQELHKGSISPTEAILLRDIPIYPRKLRDASKAKKRMIREAKKNGVSSQEIEEMEKKPASLLYAFDTREQKRIDSGETETEAIFTTQKRLINGSFEEKRKPPAKRQKLNSSAESSNDSLASPEVSPGTPNNETPAV